MDVRPVSLEGEHVGLEPLSLADHLADLQEAGSDPTIFRWFSEDHSTPEAMRTFVEDAIASREDGTALPFATVHRESGDVVGSTRFGNIEPDHRCVEIGWTWLAPAHQRTPANTEAKYLMLRHAFEVWDCKRVELVTDSRNQKSRTAIERIGATQEGVLRQHRNTHQGTRDTVVFSILDVEWDHVRADLEAKLGRGTG